MLNRNPVFILDGGHNPQCACALARNLDLYLPMKKVIFLMGVLADKDYASMSAVLSKYACEFICVTPDSPRALTAADLAKFLMDAGAVATAYKSIEQGMAAAIEKADGRPVVAFGSLYMAGLIRNTYKQLNYPQVS